MLPSEVLFLEAMVSGVLGSDKVEDEEDDVDVDGVEGGLEGGLGVWKSSLLVVEAADDDVAVELMSDWGRGGEFMDWLVAK